MMIEDESFGIIPLRRKTSGAWEVFLILHKNGHHWSFPKGHKEHEEEDPFCAAERELLEETGMRIAKAFSLPALHESYEFRHHGKPVRKKVVYYMAEVT